MDELDRLMAEEGISGVDEIGASSPLAAKMYVDRGEIRRLAPIGFAGPASIGPGATGTFTAQPSRATHLRRLLITSDNPLSELAITAMRVGDKDQLLAGDVAATLYSDAAQGGTLIDNFDALPPNTVISITLRNDGIAAAAARVSGKAVCNRG